MHVAVHDLHSLRRAAPAVKASAPADSMSHRTSAERLTASAKRPPLTQDALPRDKAPYTPLRAATSHVMMQPAKGRTITEPGVLCLNTERGEMAKLTTAKKKAEPEKEFGLPEERKYPMPDKSHARNAKARASQMEREGKLSAADKKKIDTKANRVLGK
jgi:hypothetical protein